MAVKRPVRRTHQFNGIAPLERVLDEVDSKEAVAHTVLRSMTARRLTLVLAGLCCACATTGSGWMAEAWDPSHPTADDPDENPSDISVPRPIPSRSRSHSSRNVNAGANGADEDAFAGTINETDVSPSKSSERRINPKITAPHDGKVLGTFRNTYYDFPSESDFSGEPVPLFDAQCKSKISVPKAFFESLCVQGSGLLNSGNAVSFNRRDCQCAPICPRTGQKICFDVLDISKYPWGRGATGQPIMPLLTVAVDSSILPLGTSLYIPEFDGLPRDPERRTKHDGCFVAQDRGLHVQGQHVDIFTGQAAITRLWNSLVPSNSGVTVILNSPHCDRATVN